MLLLSALPVTRRAAVLLKALPARLCSCKRRFWTAESGRPVATLLGKPLGALSALSPVRGVPGVGAVEVEGVCA